MRHRAFAQQRGCTSGTKFRVPHAQSGAAAPAPFGDCAFVGGLPHEPSLQETLRGSHAGQGKCPTSALHSPPERAGALAPCRRRLAVSGKLRPFVLLSLLSNKGLVLKHSLRIVRM